MSFWQKYKPYIVQVLIALGVGGLSALLSGGMDTYGDLVQPPLSPPGWLFPVAWSILYILMGIAAGRIVTSHHKDSGGALGLYYLQLVLNFWWSPIFFRLGWLTFAAIWLAALVVAVYATRSRFGRIDAAAGWLLLPYLLWCLFALYLNIGIVVLN